ncbi:hypothetical protein P9J64_14375 [Deltaproteobacteria bacterium IMCC39524]|nr:hypothetical protein [Deltaproteobacteria bacterium IMCC39524]
MKKIVFLTMVMILAVSGYAFADGAALASNTVTTTDGMQIYGGVDAADAARTNGVLLGKMSKGVSFRSAYLVGGFSAATYHMSGSKSYGTAHNSTAIFFQDIGDQAAAGAWSLSSADNGAFGDAWTSM